MNQVSDSQVSFPKCPGKTSCPYQQVQTEPWHSVMNGLNKVASLCSEDEFCLCWQPDYWKPDEANKGFLHLCVFSHSVVSDSLWCHGLQPTRLLCPWDFPGKNTGAGCIFSSGNLPDPRIEPESPTSPALTGRFFTTEPPGKSPSPPVIPIKTKEDFPSAGWIMPFYQFLVGEEAGGKLFVCPSWHTAYYIHKIIWCLLSDFRAQESILQREIPECPEPVGMCVESPKRTSLWTPYALPSWNPT